jgi:hypothetical protein
MQEVGELFLDAKSSAKILSQHKDKYMKWQSATVDAAFQDHKGCKKLLKHLKVKLHIHLIVVSLKLKVKALVMFLYSQVNLCVSQLCFQWSEEIYGMNNFEIQSKLVFFHEFDVR